MLDRPRAVSQVHRVLRPSGTFVCLTPDGGYCWYRNLAPMLGVDTRHLSTDRFLTVGELEILIGGAGLALERVFKRSFLRRATAGRRRWRCRPPRPSPPER